jgi:hypothetical protein
MDEIFFGEIQQHSQNQKYLKKPFHTLNIKKSVVKNKLLTICQFFRK